MRGKYSPTVNAAYRADNAWWDKYANPNKDNTYNQYDPEGYDSYGYNEHDIDRAGNHELYYIHNDWSDDSGEGENWAHNDALEMWGFDGVKPVLLEDKK